MAVLLQVLDSSHSHCCRKLGAHTADTAGVRTHEYWAEEAAGASTAAYAVGTVMFQ